MRECAQRAPRRMPHLGGRRLKSGPLLVLRNAGSPQPVNVLPGFPVVDELGEHDKVEKYSPQAAHQPAEALDEIVVLRAFEQDARDVCQVARDSEDEEG